MSTASAASLLSVIAGASVVGRLAIGAFADRIGGKRGFILCLLPLVASLLAFLVIESQSSLFAAAVGYGFSHGGLFTIVAPTVAEYFGTRAVGAIFGGIVFLGTVGGAIGPILGWPDFRRYRKLRRRFRDAGKHGGAGVIPGAFTAKDG